MISGKKITLCLPCRNEGKNLKQVIRQIPAYIDEIIIISNASTDNTVEVAKSISRKVRVIEDDRTLHGIGYGFAHISGIKSASGDIIVGADADGTYPVENIDNMIKFLIEKKTGFYNLHAISCQAGYQNSYQTKNWRECTQLGSSLVVPV